MLISTIKLQFNRLSVPRLPPAIQPKFSLALSSVSLICLSRPLSPAASRRDRGHGRSRAAPSLSQPPRGRTTLTFSSSDFLYSHELVWPHSNAQRKLPTPAVNPPLGYHSDRHSPRLWDGVSLPKSQRGHFSNRDSPGLICHPVTYPPTNPLQSLERDAEEKGREKQKRNKTKINKKKRKKKLVAIPSAHGCSTQGGILPTTPFYVTGRGGAPAGRPPLRLRAAPEEPAVDTKEMADTAFKINILFIK